MSLYSIGRPVIHNETMPTPLTLSDALLILGQ